MGKAGSEAEAQTPGFSRVTLTPCLRRASWQLRLQPRSPNLAALYTGNAATGLRAAVEPMLMMVPLCFSTWSRNRFLCGHRDWCELHAGNDPAEHTPVHMHHHACMSVRLHIWPEMTHGCCAAAKSGPWMGSSGASGASLPSCPAARPCPTPLDPLSDDADSASSSTYGLTWL